MLSTAKDCLQKLIDISAKRWISIDELFDQCDADKSGGITKDELELLLDEVNLSDSVNLDDIWNALDGDNDGEVSRDEWHKCFSTYVPKRYTSKSIVWMTKPSYKENIPGGLVALVAHNKMKVQMASFVETYLEIFKHCRIVTTGSTGKTLEDNLGLKVHHKVASGPLGGDQEIGAFVTQGLISAIFFFKDPLSSHQHSADIEALTRICDVHNVPYATNSASGKGLVIALASLGLDFGMSSGESDTVKEYKAEQAEVIRKVSMRNLMI